MRGPAPSAPLLIFEHRVTDANGKCRGATHAGRPACQTPSQFLLKAFVHTRHGDQRRRLSPGQGNAEKTRMTAERNRRAGEHGTIGVDHALVAMWQWQE